MSRYRHTARAWSIAGLCALTLFATASANVGAAQANPDKVLILDPTVTNGASSLEATDAANQGFQVDVVNNSTWASKTAAQFASYRAIIFGDPTCSTDPSSPSSPIYAALNNESTWGPAINGNVVIIGTDPVFHQPSHSGAGTLIDRGIAYATDQAGHTGAYVDLSCYYHTAGANTPVPLLDAIHPSGFTVEGSPTGCEDNIHIVATHPALQGLTDADLSGWSCSVHEVFDSYPNDFTVLAIATDGPPTYTSSDNVSGTPYILARGGGISSTQISLSPADATNPTGATHQLTALVSSGGTPQQGVFVTFNIISGPNVGLSGADTTDSNGVAHWSYSSSVTGTDTIQASFVDSSEHIQTSNQVTKTWVPPAGADLSITKTDSAPFGPDPVTAGNNVAYGIDVTNNGPGQATNVEVDDPLPNGTTFVSASGNGWNCTFDSELQQVTCTRPTLDVGAAPTITLIIRSPGTPPEGGTITNTASATDDQGSNVQTSENTTVNPTSPDQASGDVPPTGGSVQTGTRTTPADNTNTKVILPPGPGGVVTIDETAFTDPTFCNGPCNGKEVTVGVPDGYTDPNTPIRIVLKFDATLRTRGTIQIYVKKDSLTPVLVPDCNHFGIAFPSPCVASRRTLESGDQRVRVLMLSGDPAYGKRR